MADAPTTLTVEGEGGHRFEMDLPEEGTNRREIFDHMVAKGWLTIIEPEPEKKPRGRAAAPAAPVVAEPADD